MSNVVAKTIYAIWKVANYEVTNPNSSTKILTTTLNEAEAATTGAGATIKVLNNTSEALTVAFSKNTTLNLNGKTLTRGASIHATAGTLTIQGSGTIQATSTFENALVYANNGNITITNAAVLNATKGRALSTADDNTGKITISGSRLTSSEFMAVLVQTTGNTISITDTNIFTPSRHNALQIGGVPTSVNITSSMIVPS